MIFAILVIVGFAALLYEEAANRRPFGIVTCAAWLFASIIWAVNNAF